MAEEADQLGHHDWVLLLQEVQEIGGHLAELGVTHRHHGGEPVCHRLLGGSFLFRIWFLKLNTLNTG